MSKVSLVNNFKTLCASSLRTFNKTPRGFKSASYGVTGGALLLSGYLSQRKQGYSILHYGYDDKGSSSGPQGSN